MNNFDPYYGGYGLTVRDALVSLWDKVLYYLPNILIAGIVLIVGWIIGTFLGNVLRRALEMTGIDKAINRGAFARFSERTGRQVSIARIVQWLVKWFFFLASFVAAANILGLTQVTDFLYQDVLGYAGHVIVAMAILMLGMLAANFFGDIVEAALRASKLHMAGTLGSLTRWAILAFAAIATLSELQIAQSFLNYLFLGVVVMLALAGGLAFGLGGRDHARKILDHIEAGLGRRM